MSEQNPEQTMTETIIPSKRIDSGGDERDMESPYEIGGYYCTIGLTILDNPYPQVDQFNHRRFNDGFRDRSKVKLC